MDAVKILGSLLGGGAMTSGQGDNALGGLLRGALSGGQGGAQGGDASGGLGDLLGSVLGGAAGGQSRGQSGGLPGGLGDILGSALGGSRGSGSGGGLGDILGAALGGRQGGGSGGLPGGLGDILGAALGGGRSAGGRSGGIGGALGGVAMAAILKYAMSKMREGGSQAQEGGLNFADIDTPEVNGQAELLIEAMINAAKADGRVDAAEEQAILQRLGDLDAEETAFIRSKLLGSVDAAAFAARVPAHLAREVYATSLLAMELDERSEALYLRDLAQGLSLDAATCNAIHQEMDVPPIFR